MERKGIFISIPKNASRSLLRHMGCRNGMGIHSRLRKRILSNNFIHDNHARAVVLKDRYGEIFEKGLKFCVLRNPFERAQSWYLYHRNTPPCQNLDFNDWVLSDCPHHWASINGTRYSTLTKPTRSLYKDAEYFYNPIHQHIFVCDDNDNILVDEFLFLKSLDKDMLRVAKALGHPLFGKLPRVNTTTKQPKDKIPFSKEAKNHLRKLLAKDFSLFDFDRLFHNENHFK